MSLLFRVKRTQHLEWYPLKSGKNGKEIFLVFLFSFFFFFLLEGRYLCTKSCTGYARSMDPREKKCLSPKLVWFSKSPICHCLYPITHCTREVPSQDTCPRWEYRRQCFASQVGWAGFPPPKNRGHGVWSTTRADRPACSTLTQAKLDLMGNYYSKKPSSGAVDHSLQARSKLDRTHTEPAELSQLNCVGLNSFLSGPDTVNNPGPRGLDYISSHEQVGFNTHLG